MKKYKSLAEKNTFEHEDVCVWKTTFSVNLGIDSFNISDVCVY